MTYVEKRKASKMSNDTDFTPEEKEGVIQHYMKRFDDAHQYPKQAQLYLETPTVFLIHLLKTKYDLDKPSPDKSAKTTADTHAPPPPDPKGPKGAPTPFYKTVSDVITAIANTELSETTNRGFTDYKRKQVIAAVTDALRACIGPSAKESTDHTRALLNKVVIRANDETATKPCLFRLKPQLSNKPEEAETAEAESQAVAEMPFVGRVVDAKLAMNLNRSLVLPLWYEGGCEMKLYMDGTYVSAATSSAWCPAWNIPRVPEKKEDDNDANEPDAKKKKKEEKKAKRQHFATHAVSWRDLDVTVDDTILKFKRPVLVELPLPPESLKEDTAKEQSSDDDSDDDPDHCSRDAASQVPPLDASVLPA